MKVHCETCDRLIESTEATRVEDCGFLCDSCTGYSVPLLNNEEKYSKARKQLWARVFSVTSDKMSAYRMMDRLVKKVKAWSFYDMDLNQLDECYRLTNVMENRI